MTTTYTAIIQCGYAIFGVGATLDEAIADANQRLEPKIGADDLKPGSVIGQLYKATISERLFEAVRARGGDIEWDFLNDGTLCLPSEIVDAA